MEQAGLSPLHFSLIHVLAVVVCYARTGAAYWMFESPDLALEAAIACRRKMEAEHYEFCQPSTQSPLDHSTP